MSIKCLEVGDMISSARGDSIDSVSSGAACCQLCGSSVRRICAHFAAGTLSFDQKAAKSVQKKAFGNKDDRFTGSEHDASSLFARLVEALREVYMSEESAFNSLFALDDAGLTVRVEATALLYSTLELLVDPASAAADWMMDSSGTTSPRDGKRVLLEFARRLSGSGSPFRGTSELLSLRFTRDVDPHENTSLFNNALADVRRRSTVHDEEVKDQFISRALDADYYSAVISRLLLQDQRAAHDLLTIQQWMKKQIVTLHNKINDKGFTPRAQKPRVGPGSKGYRFAAGPTPGSGGGNASQTTSKKLAFHQGTGQTVPFCGNDECNAEWARHWHHDCPNGGPRANTSAHAFCPDYSENDMLAVSFQSAIDNNDAEKSDALCVLAGGKPEMISDFSACSFCETDGECLVSSISEYTEYVRPAESQIRFSVGDAVSGDVNINKDSDDDGRVADALDGRRHRSGVGGVSVPCDTTAGVTIIPPRHGPAYRPLLAVCMLFAFGATAEPLTGSAVGGVSVIDPVDFFDFSLTSTASSNVDRG
ncbi:hypothetical protein CYMTET_19086, partial [Cymbomonas tetramitiformis]